MKWDGIERRSKLRREAESMISSMSPNQLTAQPNEVLVHELLVHKVELEMQNEELRDSHHAMEVARDRYLHLYELSPISYITLNIEAKISEINLTACNLLGLNRTKSISQDFATSVAPEAREHWQHLFSSKMNLTEGKIGPHDLEMLRADGSVFFAHLDCLKIQVENNAPMMRIALTDISPLKIAESEMRVAAIVFESNESMMITDNNCNILRVNQAFTNKTGYFAEEVVGLKSNLLKSNVHSEEFFVSMWESINRDGSWLGKIFNKRKDGEVYSEFLRITTVKSEQGEVTNYIAVYSTLRI